MAPWHYTRDELAAGIRAVGIGAGDVVSLQVSLGRLGLPRDVPANVADISGFIIDVFLDVLGDGGTLIVPTYTYSIGRGERFEVETTPSGIGEFTELFRQREGVIRSRDPMLSSAGLGPGAADVLRTISRSCYGEGSTYHRLRDVNAKICTLGLGHHWATFRHHIEEMAEVPFRFHKRFHGIVREHGVDSAETWLYYAAPLVECCQPHGLPLERLVRAEGALAVAAIGRSEIMSIGAQVFFEFGLQAFRKNPWLSAKGPACSRDELVSLEDARVGARAPIVALAAGASMPEMIEATWRLRRDVVSDGSAATLEALGRQVPMIVHRYATGAERGSPPVPEKWTCRDACLETLDGDRLLSSADNPLHVASYSQPIDRIVGREELLRHLLVHPVLADATPWHELSETQDWGLCASQAFRASLADDEYRVRIDAAFSFGAMRVGEVVVRGATDDCIVLCAHLDGPAQANNGLSGCVVGVDVMRELARHGQRRFTYRLVLAPGPLGFLAYFAGDAPCARVQGGLFLDMVGLDKPIALQHRADHESSFGACCTRVLKSIEPGFRRFSRVQSTAHPDDEFHTGILPESIVPLSRAYTFTGDRASLFEAYRSDQDDMTSLSVSRLRDTSRAVLAIVDAWEAQWMPHSADVAVRSESR